MLLISFSIGLFFTSIAHDASSFQGMAMFYFFLVSFMGGMMFPGKIPAECPGTVREMSRTNPGNVREMSGKSPGNVKETSRKNL